MRWRSVFGFATTVLFTLLFSFLAAADETNDVVTDPSTGLMWHRNVSDESIVSTRDGSGKEGPKIVDPNAPPTAVQAGVSYSLALRLCSESKAGGFGDWRVPTAEEFIAYLGNPAAPKHGLVWVMVRVDRTVQPSTVNIASRHANNTKPDAYGVQGICVRDTAAKPTGTDALAQTLSAAKGGTELVKRTQAAVDQWCSARKKFKITREALSKARADRDNCLPKTSKACSCNDKPACPHVRLLQMQTANERQQAEVNQLDNAVRNVNGRPHGVEGLGGTYAQYVSKLQQQCEGSALK